MRKVLLLAAAVVTLFASCSKEAIDNVSVNSDAAFTASMSFDNQVSTRHHINARGNYEWEAGDMVGVSNGVTTVPFVTKLGGTVAAFNAAEGDLAYLGTASASNPYYMVYPYGGQVTVVTGTDEITVDGMTIPTTQRYRANSFATMTAPAFAVVSSFEDGQNIEFNAPASMLSFPIVGKGTLNKLTLTSTNYPIAGAIKAVIAENAEGETVVTYTTVGTEKEITVDFGAGSFVLDYENSVANVVFVVASGKIGATAENFTLKADWANGGSDTDYFTIPANTVLAPNTLYEMKTRTFGLDEYFVIGKGDNNIAVRDFILYAFATQDDLGGNRGISELYPDMNDANVLAQHMGIDNVADVLGLKLLFTRDSINFDGFDAEAMYTGYGTSEYKNDDMAALYRKALLWYIENGNAIETIDASKSAVEGGLSKATVIDGLVVLGNGITSDTKLQNLEFTNTTVVATDADYAGFLIADASTAVVKDIVLGENNILNVTKAEGFVGGIAGRMFTGNSKISGLTVNALPVMISTQAENAPAKNAGQIYGYAGIEANTSLDLNAYKVASLAAPAIHTVAGSGNVLDFKNAPAATYTNVVATNKPENPVSIVIGGVSYWNGAVATTVKNDDYFTAEELAYAVANAGSTYEFKNNIDMQCYVQMNEEGTEVESSRTLNVNHVINTIFNIDGKGFALKNIIANKPLFGYSANISNLNISNVEINVDGKYVYIAGLSRTGTATNVVIDGMAINIAKTAVANNESDLTTNSIGGLFSIVDADDIDNVEVKSCNIVYAGENKLNARAGIIAGTLNIEPNTTVNLKPSKLSGKTNKYVFTNIGTKQPASEKLKWYTSGNAYALSSCPYGVISVNNADFATNGNVNAYLNDHVDSQNFGRLAAGVVFSFANGAPKAFGNDASESGKYTFTSNKKINNDAVNGEFVWVFNSTIE